MFRGLKYLANNFVRTGVDSMNDSIFEIGAPGIDVSKIVEEIRASVAEKMENPPPYRRKPMIPPSTTKMIQLAK